MSDSSDDDDLWEAMADPTRRKLLDLLVARGHATATTLTADMPVSRQAISKHLSLLQRVGLIDGHRQGREVRYEVREQRLAEATGALSEVANRWDRRLRAIKQLAEQAHAADRSVGVDTNTDHTARTAHRLSGTPAPRPAPIAGRRASRPSLRFQPVERRRSTRCSIAPTPL